MNPEGAPKPCGFQHCCLNFSPGKNGNCTVEMDDVLECWVDNRPEVGDGMCKITGKICHDESYICEITHTPFKQYQNNDGKHPLNDQGRQYQNFQCLNFTRKEKGEEK